MLKVSQDYKIELIKVPLWNWNKTNMESNHFDVSVTSTECIICWQTADVRWSKNDMITRDSGTWNVFRHNKHSQTCWDYQQTIKLQRFMASSLAHRNSQQSYLFFSSARTRFVTRPHIRPPINIMPITANITPMK